MTRFHFNTSNGRTHRDIEGEELSSLSSARVEAVKLLAELLREQAEDFWATSNFDLTVTDDRGLTLFALTVNGVIAPAGRSTGGRR